MTCCRFLRSKKSFKLAAIHLFAGILLACGGGGGTESTAAASSPPLPGGTPSVTGTPITTLKLHSNDSGGNVALNVPVTFGQVFVPGDWSPSAMLVGQFEDGSQIPLQTDIKATNPDGSVRHAIISAVLPKLASGATHSLTLLKTSNPQGVVQPTSPAGLLANGFTASVNVTLGGVQYSASADALLKSGKYKTWLSGPLVSEWEVAGPLTTAAGVPHPHLTARFAVRSYAASSTSVDVTVENDWAYQPAPQNFTYDTQILVGGRVQYSKSGLTHYHHARWRKVLWYGAQPAVDIAHDKNYMIATKAVPNYDPSVMISPALTFTFVQAYTGAVTEPMGTGLAMPAQPTTGGRPDIGLLPGWAAAYLISQDPKLKAVTLGTASLAGSYPCHYRNQNTDRPITLVDYPYMTIAGNVTDTMNPVTKKLEAFPTCGGVCTSPNMPDSPHAPSLAFLPYMMTGDYYYLEELQFWTNWHLFHSNPGYRGAGAGLFHATQARGQAWIMRDLADTAFITPDSDTQKKMFETILSNNLDWYNANYTNNPAPQNTLGAFTDPELRAYDNYTGYPAWQDDFFTSAAGHTLDLGYAKAKPLLAWKSKFVIKRMTDPKYCWIVGAPYSFHVADSYKGAAYTDMGVAYQASNPTALTSLPCGGPEMANYLKLKVGEMTGYSSSNTGFPSNMQPALAYAANSGAPGGADAWKAFQSRAVKPDYSTGPQFAIVPR